VDCGGNNIPKTAKNNMEAYFSIILAVGDSGQQWAKNNMEAYFSIILAV
jgi:hypothetical protein